MKLQILDRATTDLIEGYGFYEDREAGLGRYFLTNLSTDIESLRILEVFIPKPIETFIGLFRKDFLSLSFTKWMEIQ